MGSDQGLCEATRAVQPRAMADLRGEIYPHLGCLSEKAMATHSNTLAWKIPWTEGPGVLQSMGSLGVRHN